jgi:membrane associated rhomboid family serine protease
MTNYGNSFQRTSPVVLNLIIINALVFAAQSFLDGPEEKITNLLAQQPRDFGFEPYQLVTCMFAHSTFIHLLFNMFALWVFGVTLEKVWGPKRFLIFYLVCGLAASVGIFFLSKDGGLGASGAIMGLMGAFAYLFPNTPFIIFPVPFPIKAKYLVVIIALVNLLGLLAPRADDNIGYLAHLAGLVAGLIMVIIWNKTNKRTFY